MVAIPSYNQPYVQDLLFGGYGLYYVSSEDLLKDPTNPPQLLDNLNFFPDVDSSSSSNSKPTLKKLVAVHPSLKSGLPSSGQLVSVFAMSTDGRVCLVRLEMVDIVQSKSAQVVQVCGKGVAVDINAFRPMDDGSTGGQGGVVISDDDKEMVFILDQLGNVSVWEEDVISKTWSMGEVLWA